MLINLIVVILSHVYIYQIITLYTLNICNFICQLRLNKAEGKKEWYIVKYYNMYKTWKYYANWKKPDVIGDILYDSINMKCPE